MLASAIAPHTVKISKNQLCEEKICYGIQHFAITLSQSPAITF